MTSSACPSLTISAISSTLPVPSSVAGRGSLTVTTARVDRFEVDGARQADRLVVPRFWRARQPRPV